MLQFVSVSPAVTLLKGQKETLSCTIPNAPYSVKVNWFRSSDDVMVKEYTSDHADAEYTSTHEVGDADSYYCKATYTAKDPFKGGDLKSDTISVTVVDYTV